MRDIKDLPAWERLFKKIVWKQLGEIKDKNILDFGSLFAYNAFLLLHLIIAMNAVLAERNRQKNINKGS